MSIEEEAGFGRINKPKYCWYEKGIRPSVPCHYIREYDCAFGAVKSRTGESFFLILPQCDTVCMNYNIRSAAEEIVLSEFLCR